MAFLFILGLGMRQNGISMQLVCVEREVGDGGVRSDVNVNNRDVYHSD